MGVLNGYGLFLLAPVNSGDGALVNGKIWRWLTEIKLSNRQVIGLDV